MHQYIFIIGAAKCGTTALSDILGQCPEICLSKLKESDFFTNRIFSIESIEWYKSLFDHKPNAMYRLDASVSYTLGWGNTSTHIAKRIKDFAPDAKLVYIIRDPIERTWASYWHDERNLKKQSSFLNSIDSSSHHVTGSKYPDRIDDYLTCFNSNQLLVVDFHRFKHDYTNVLKEIFDFIGIEGIDSKRVKKVEKNRSYRFNFLGTTILRFISLGVVRKVVSKINPDSPIKKLIRRFITAPLPTIEQPESDVLRAIYSDGCDRIKCDYKINLKTSSHWTEV